MRTAKREKKISHLSRWIEQAHYELEALEKAQNLATNFEFSKSFQRQNADKMQVLQSKITWLRTKRARLEAKR